jgi:nucleotide-binding universal stress UspA family protein
MFRKILVAINCSPQGEKLFEQALYLAKVTQAHLMLLHVLSLEQDDCQPSSSVSNFDSDLVFNEEPCHKKLKICRQYGLELLRSLTKRATIAGVKTEFSQVTGSPCQIICTLAKTWQADLIIIGCQNDPSLQKPVLGSVGNYVSYHAPCSILIVPGSIKKNRSLSLPQRQELVSSRSYALTKKNICAD